MVELGTMEPDAENMETLTDPILEKEKNNNLENPDVKSMIEVSNKRTRDEFKNDDRIENSVKKQRQDENLEDASIGSSIVDNDEIVMEIDSVIGEDGDGITKVVDQVELSNNENDENTPNDQNNHQENNEENAETVNDKMNVESKQDDPPDKERIFPEKDEMVTVNYKKEECEVVCEGPDDKSVEIYIQEEIEKRVKERMEKWLQAARNQLIEECKLAVIRKEVEIERKDEDEEAEVRVDMLDPEQEKRESIEEDTKEDSEKRGKKRDELIKVILAEKELEEKEKILKIKREKLKIFETKLIKEEDEIKEKRKKNQAWLETRLKEWENEGKKPTQRNDQDPLIQDNGVQEDNRHMNGELKSEIEANKVQTRTEEGEKAEWLNKLRELQNASVINNKIVADREGRRPDQMSAGEWTQEDKERRKRRRNVRIKGLNPRNWRTGREIEDFFRREMGVEVIVDNITRVGMDLVVSFRSLSEKMDVLRKRVKVKNSRIWIGDDLTPREEEVQEWLKEEADWLRLKGRIVKLGHLKMTINGTRWIWNEVKGDLMPEVFL